MSVSCSVGFQQAVHTETFANSAPLTSLMQATTIPFAMITKLSGIGKELFRVLTKHDTILATAFWPRDRLHPGA